MGTKKDGTHVWDATFKKPEIGLIRDSFVRGYLYPACANITAPPSRSARRNDMVKSKCCPFCGGFRFYVQGYAGPWGNIPEPSRVVCGTEGCEANGPMRGSRDEAIEAWNDRKMDD